MYTTIPESTTDAQLVKLYLRALNCAGRDPEAAAAAVCYAEALDRRRGVGRGATECVLVESAA